MPGNEPPEDRPSPLLLDTHAFLWWLDGDQNLSHPAQQAIGEAHRDWSATRPYSITSACSGFGSICLSTMTIVDILVKQILSDAQIQRRGDLLLADEAPDDGLLLPGIFDNAPDLDRFRERAPDSGESFLESSLSLLGTYQWIASPGIITLYRGNIEAYWKSLIRHAQRQFPFVTTKDAERVLQLLVYSVYQHERFHYVCDFCRRLFGGSFDRWHEEALAVAWEWQWLRSQDRWNSFYGLMHPTLRRSVVQAMFDYRSPGYRDWRQFANQGTSEPRQRA